MKFASHALLAACLGVALSAQAQETIDLSGATAWGGENNRIYISGIKIPGQTSAYGTRFTWDAATNSLKADLSTVSVSGSNPPACTPRFFYEASIANSAFPAPLTKQAYIMVTAEINIFTRRINLSLQPEQDSTGNFPEISPYFFPQQLRLIQNGVTYSVHDVSNNNAPHLVPSNGWIPTQTPVSNLGYSMATITNFPASFDLSKPFYFYYGKGTPTTPATDGTDSYTLCNG